MDIVSNILDALRSVLTSQDAFYPLHEPLFSGNEWAYTKECIDTGWVSTAGKYVEQFEHNIAEYTGSNYAIAVVNGTSALHIALMLAGVKENDEVFVPTLTFVATSNAVTYCNAIPHFVDCEESTLGVNPTSLHDYLQKITIKKNGFSINKETGRIIRAIVPMHAFGHPLKIESICTICKEFNIKVVEDAAESLGSYINNKHTGTLGSLGVLSFNGNKIITTGGGGVILTNDNELAQKAKHITTTSKLAHKWEYFHDEVGYNYRMPNINAALGCAQLEQLPKLLKAKRTLYMSYKKAFDKIDDVRLVSEPDGCFSNYWLQTLLLNDSISDIRDKILTVTNDSGIMTRPAWTLMHKLPPYNSAPRMNLSTAESIEKRLINIPSSPQIVL